jgi:NADH dehydrogenase [ubiquinone] 1 alpha subcomplex assembly factor 3
MLVLGPMALFPRSVLAWNVAGPQDISTDTLELFFRLEPRIGKLKILQSKVAFILNFFIVHKN